MTQNSAKAHYVFSPQTSRLAYSGPLRYRHANRATAQCVSPWANAHPLSCTSKMIYCNAGSDW